MAFIGKGELDLAVQDLDKALSLNLNYALAYALRGSVYSDKGNLDQAIHDLNRALALDPTYANGFNDRGVVYLRKGIHARAMQDFDKALNLRPNKAAFTNRGIGFMVKGEWEKARADLIRPATWE